MEENRIFVGGLKYTTTEDTLGKYFSKWGEVKDIKLVKYPPPDSRSKGFAFVTYFVNDSRDKCYADRPHNIDDKDVDLRLSDREGRSGGSDPVAVKLNLEDVKFRRLFVGSLDKEWTESVIEAYFGSLGDIEECTVKRGPSGDSLGFAFLTFRNSRDVDSIQNSRAHTIQGRPVETRRQVAKQNVGKPEAKLEVDRIWIGPPDSDKKIKGHHGLSDAHTDEDLEEYFSQFGKVRKIQQLMWADQGSNKKRGYGFIYFTDFDAVDKVVLQHVHIVQGTRLEVKKAIQEGGRNQTKGRDSNQDYSNNRSQGNNSNNMMNNVNNFPMQNNMMGNMMGGGGSNMYGMPPVSNMSLPPNMNGDDRGGRKRGFDRGGDSNDMNAKKTRLEIRDPESNIMRSVFVGNLNPMMTKDELNEYMNNYGTVVNCDLRMQPNSEKNKGFAFVMFNKACDVDKLMAARPHNHKGTKIDCKRKTPQGENLYMDEKVNKVWIGRPDAEYRIKSFGLDESTTDEVLKEFFGRFGRVVEVYQFTWKDTNKKRGYGYITFEDTDVVDKLVLLGVHDVDGVKLQIKKALTKDVQEALEKKKLLQQGGGMDRQQDYSNSRGSTPSQSSMMPMGGGGNMQQQGYNNSMGGMGMNNSMDNMNSMMMMNQMQQQMSGGGGMNPMQNMGVPSMLGQQGGFNNPMMGGGGGNQLMNQMQSMPPMANMNTNNQMMANNMNNSGFGGARPAGPAGMNDMMQNMSSMMGTMKDAQKGGAKNDASDKMMGMMGNMMSMMSNMASIMQTQVGGESNTNTTQSPSPVRAPSQTSTRPSRFDIPHSTSGVKREQPAYNNGGGNSNNQTSNYGHTYGSAPGSYPSSNQGGGGSAYPDTSSRGWNQGGGSQAPQPPSGPPPMGGPPPSIGTPSYGSNWSK